MRYRTPPAKRLSTIPSCAGVMTRAACARARAAGVDLPPLLRRIGLTARDIENESVPLRVTSQIKCLNLMAEALGDRLLGFHVAQGMDLRRSGLLYYVAASSEVLSDALHRIARYSSMVNEGVKLEAETGEKLRIVFAYAGVPRRHDRHQIEAWTTLIIRYCRELTGRGLQALAVRLMHHRIPESGEIDSFCGRRIEFSSDMDEVSFAGETAKLPIANADPFLNKLLIGYSENVATRRSARSGVIRDGVLRRTKGEFTDAECASRRLVTADVAQP